MQKNTWVPEVDMNQEGVLYLAIPLKLVEVDLLGLEVDLHTLYGP